MGAEDKDTPQVDPISRSSGTGEPEPTEHSEEEQAGVPATDTSGASPRGVGESVARRGEDVARRQDEPGREREGTKGASERPYGTSTPRDSSDVGEQETVTDSPDLPSGDQGG
jgi:hypothetical protein